MQWLKNFFFGEDIDVRILELRNENNGWGFPHMLVERVDNPKIRLLIHQHLGKTGDQIRINSWQKVMV